MKAAIEISLPSSLKDWVDERVASEGYDSTSEFFRDLVRREQKRRAKADLEKTLLAAVASGKSTPMTAEDWQRIRSEGKKRLARRRK